MRRVARLVGASALAATLVGTSPSAVLGCTSDHPSFVEAVHGARAIARVVVVEGWDSYLDDPAHSETYRVERVLKGSLPASVTLAPAWTSLCHDSVAYYAGSDGAVIVVALDVSYYDQVIHPMWAFDSDQGLSGSAGVPPGVTMLTELEAAIRSELGRPDSSKSPDLSSGLLVVAALGAVLLSLLRRRVGSGDIRGR